MTRKRWSPLGVELAIWKMLMFMLLPLLIQAAPWQDITEIQQYTEGCYYNYNHYNEGDRILTNEPCLNCTCHNKMLMCYLRVCPFTKPIGHDCVVEKREDQCCPIITCPEVPVDIEHHLPEPGTELSIPEKYGCSIDQKFYPEGAQVPSNPNKPCELCYCIKNRTSCLMQECTLHIEGCMPIYNKGSCCPVRYNCDHENDVLELEDHSTSTTTTVRPTPGFVLTTSMSPSVPTDCIHDGAVYADGASLRGKNPCEHCYCMRGDIVCAVQECEMPMLSGNGKSCHPVTPNESKCCPSHYTCEDDSTTTQIIDATAMSYMDGDFKLPTDVPFKDMHSFVSDEDLQLQKHIDDNEKLSTEGPKKVSEGEPIEDDSDNPVTESNHAVQLDTTLSITAATLVEDKEQSIDSKIIDYATSKVLSSETEDVVGTSAAKSEVVQTPSEHKEDVHSGDATTLQIPTTAEASTEQSEEEKIVDGPIATTAFDFITLNLTRSEGTDSVAQDIEEITVSSFHKFKSEESNSDNDIVEVTTYTVVGTDDTTDSPTQSEISEPFGEIATKDVELSAEEMDSSQKPISSTISEGTDQIELTTSKNEPMEHDLRIVNAEPETSTNSVSPQDEEILDVTTINALEDKNMQNITDSNTPKSLLDKSVDHFGGAEGFEEKDVITEATNFTPYLNEEHKESIMSEEKTEVTILATSESVTLTSAPEKLEDHLTQKSSLPEKQKKQNEVDEQFEHTSTFTPTKITFIDGGEVQTVPKIKNYESDDESHEVSSDINNGSTLKDIEDNSFTDIPTTSDSLSDDIVTTASLTTIQPSTGENLDMDFPYQHITDISREKSNSTRLPLNKFDEKTEELVTSAQANIHLTTESSSFPETVEVTTISRVNVIEMEDVTKRSDLSEDATTENIFNLEKIPALIPGEGDCLVKEKTYQNNSVVPSFDACKTSCRCISSIVICQHVKCQTPADIGKCILDPVSINKCCPTYICGPESTPMDFHANVAEVEENKYISKTKEVADVQSSTEELKETATASTPIAVTGNEINESSTYVLTDTYAPIFSTEKSLSHVRDKTGDSTSSDMEELYVSSTISTSGDLGSAAVTENSDQTTAYIITTDETQTDLPADSVSNKTVPALILQLVDSSTEESEIEKLNKSEQETTTTSIAPSHIKISTEYGYTDGHTTNPSVETEDLVHITPTTPSAVIAGEGSAHDISAHSVSSEHMSTTEMLALSQDTNEEGSGSTIAGDLQFLDYTSTPSVGGEDVAHFTPTSPSLTTDGEVVIDDTTAHYVSKVNVNDSVYTFVSPTVFPRDFTEKEIEGNTTPPPYNEIDTTPVPSVDSKINTIINGHKNYIGDLENVENNNSGAMDVTTQEIPIEHISHTLSNEDKEELFIDHTDQPANDPRVEDQQLTLEESMAQTIDPNSEDMKQIITDAAKHNISSVDEGKEVTTEIYSANTIAQLNDVQNGNVATTVSVDRSEKETIDDSVMHTVPTKEQKETHSTATEYMSVELTDDYRGYTLAPVEDGNEFTDDTSTNAIISTDEHSREPIYDFMAHTVSPTVNIEKEVLDDSILNTITPSVLIAAKESMNSKEQTMTSAIEGVTESINNTLIHSEVLPPAFKTEAPLVQNEVITGEKEEIDYNTIYTTTPITYKTSEESTVDSVSSMTDSSGESDKEISDDIVTDVVFQSTNLNNEEPTAHNISPDTPREKETIDFIMAHTISETLHNKIEHIDDTTSYTTNRMDDKTTISTDNDDNNTTYTTTLSTAEVQGESGTDFAENIVSSTKTQKEAVDDSKDKAIVSSTEGKVEESFADSIASTTEFNTEVTTSAPDAEKKLLNDTEAHTIAPPIDIYTTAPIHYSVTNHTEFTVDDNIHMLNTSDDNKAEGIVTDSMEQYITPSADPEEKTVGVTSRYDAALFTEVQTEKLTPDSLTITPVLEDEIQVVDFTLPHNIDPSTTDGSTFTVRSEEKNTYSTDTAQMVVPLTNNAPHNVMSQTFASTTDAISTQTFAPVAGGEEETSDNTVSRGPIVDSVMHIGVTPGRPENDLKVTSSPYTAIPTEENTDRDDSTTRTTFSILNVKGSIDDSMALTIAPTAGVQQGVINIETSTTTPSSNDKMEDSVKDFNHTIASSNEKEYSHTSAVEDYEKLYTTSPSADDKRKVYMTSDAIENSPSTERISDAIENVTISDVDEANKTLHENASKTISPYSDKMGEGLMMHTSSPVLVTEKAQIDNFAQISTAVYGVDNASNEVRTDSTVGPSVSSKNEYIDETLSNTVNTLIEEKGNIDLMVKNDDEFITHTTASIGNDEVVSKDKQHLIAEEMTEAPKDLFIELTSTESTQIHQKDDFFEQGTSIYEREKQTEPSMVVSEMNTKNESITVDDIELALVTDKSTDIITDQSSAKSTQIYEYEQPTSLYGTEHTSASILAHTVTPSIVEDEQEGSTLSSVSSESSNVALTLDDSKLQIATPTTEESVTEIPTVVTQMQLIDKIEKPVQSEEITTDSHNHNIQQVGEFVTERVEDPYTKENIFDQIQGKDQVAISHQAPTNSSIEPMEQFKHDLLETKKDEDNEHHPTVTPQKTQVTNSLGSEIKSTMLEPTVTETNEISDVTTLSDKSRKTTVKPHSLEEVSHAQNAAKKESLGGSYEESLNGSSYTQEKVPLSTTVHQLLSHNMDHTTSEPIIGSVENATTVKDIGESSTAAVRESHTTTSTTQYPQQPGIYGQAPQYPSYPEDEYTDEDESEVFGPGTCRYGGKLFVSAQQIPRDDPCDFCFCFRSDIICLQQSCPPPISGCHEEPISGFCCPRYECPVSMATVLNITTSTTTTSTTLPPHFLQHAYEGAAQRNGCHINGKSYRVGQSIDSTSGPCMQCTCGGDGQMKCDPKTCSPEPMLRQMIAVVASRRR